MSAISVRTATVVAQDYIEREDMSEGEIADAVASGAIRVPDGWSLTSAYRVVLRVTYGASDDPYAVNPALSSARLTRIDIPVIYAFLARGAETLEVELADTRADAAQPWVDTIMREGEPGPVPLGRGFAGGPTSVIDTGSCLLRATYNDGQDPRPLDLGQLRARLVGFQDRARQNLAIFK